MLSNIRYQYVVIFRSTPCVGLSFHCTKPLLSLGATPPPSNPPGGWGSKDEVVVFHVRTIMYLYSYSITNFNSPAAIVGQQYSRSNSNLVPVYAPSSTLYIAQAVQTQTSPHKWLRHPTSDYVTPQVITSCTEIIHCNKVSRQLVQQSVVSAKAHKKALLVSEVGTAMPRRVAYAYHFHLSSEVCHDVAIKNPLSFGVQVVNYTSIFMLDHR